MSKYNSINNIEAKLFFEILHSKNFELLERENENEDLKEVFSSIYDDYFTKADNEKGKAYLELTQTIAFLEYKANTVKQVMRFLVSNKTTKEIRETLLDALISIGININKENNFLEEIQNVLQVELGIIDNEVSLAKIDLENIQNKDKSKVFDFYESLVNLETVLERNLLDDVTLIKFVYYEKMCEAKLKAQEKNNKKTH